ncbi:hypothetical protein [Metabacillus fastidiosus]
MGLEELQKGKKAFFWISIVVFLSVLFVSIQALLN